MFACLILGLSCCSVTVDLRIMCVCVCFSLLEALRVFKFPEVVLSYYVEKMAPCLAPVVCVCVCVFVDS